MFEVEDSMMVDFFIGKRGVLLFCKWWVLIYGCICLIGVWGNNFKNIMVEFFLGLFCLVIGISGVGKSFLV